MGLMSDRRLRLRRDGGEENEGRESRHREGDGRNAKESRRLGSLKYCKSGILVRERTHFAGVWFSERA